MKNLLLIFIVSLASIAFSCSVSQNPSESDLFDSEIVEDSPKNSDYYSDHSCDDYVEFKNPDNPNNTKKVSEKKLSIKEKPREGRKLASASDLYGLAGSERCPDVTRSELDDLEYSAKRFNGALIDPRNYESSTEGFQDFLNDTGVISKFSATEMVAAHKPHHARSCGFENLRPAQCRWPSGAVQGLLAGEMRGVINNGDPYGPKKITLRNWWRPRCYNEKVDGAKASDHIQARGFDLDFSTPNDRAVAQKFLCDLYREEAFNLQVGIGCRTLHIGMGSPKRIRNHAPNGSRFWTYGSLKNCEIKRLTSDKCWLMDSKGNKRIYSDKSGFKGAL